MWAQIYFVLSQITHLTDGQTASFLVTRPRCMQCMQLGKNLNNWTTSDHIWVAYMLFSFARSLGLHEPGSSCVCWPTAASTALRLNTLRRPSDLSLAVEHVNTSDQPRRQAYWYHPRVVRLRWSVNSQWLSHGLGMLYRNTFRTRLLFPSSAKNWRPFCSGRRSLMRSDNVLCFIRAPVAQCWSVTMYWLLQTDFVDIVRWSCSSSTIMPPK